VEFLNVEERSKGWICVVGRRPVAERSRRDRSAEAGRNFIVLSSFFDAKRQGLVCVSGARAKNCRIVAVCSMIVAVRSLIVAVCSMIVAVRSMIVAVRS